MDTKDKKNFGIDSEEEFYTCSTCNIIYRNLHTCKEHYRSQWHRYNLHRKIADLSPITLEEFEIKNSIYDMGTSQTSQTKQTWNCKFCRKKFNNEQQYKNHLDSKNHKKKIKEVDEVIFQKDLANVKEETEIEMDSDVESLDSNEWFEDLDNPIKYNNCLFCDHHSRSVMYNLKHMMEKHSFVVPDLNYCIDQKGLLMHLGQKIYGEYKCIWCNNSGRQLQSAEAVKMHMIDKGHCKLLFDGEAMLEYLQFYDYSGINNSDLDKNLQAVSMDFLDDGSFNLRLPSGKVIGHRSLMLYYKQNLNPETVAITKDNSQKLRKLMQQYRALGGPEMQAEATRRRVRDIQYLQRFQTKYSTQLQFKQNKLQKCFRPQMLF